MKFAWEEAKHLKNERERGFGFDYASEIFQGEPIEWIDDRFDYGEPRVRAVGQIGQKCCTSSTRIGARCDG